MKHNQKTEVCLSTAFPSFPPKLGCPLHPGEAGVGNSYRSLLREILQVLAAAPKGDIPCHTTFAGSRACGGPVTGVLSAGLTEGKVPPGWAPSRPLTDGKKPLNFYTCKSFTPAHGAAPLFPFQRTILFGNTNKCLLYHAWVWCVELCAHRLCFSGMNHLPQLSTTLKEFCIRFFDAGFFCQTSYQSALHHSSSADAELHILSEGNFPDVWKVFSPFLWP